MTPKPPKANNQIATSPTNAITVRSTWSCTLKFGMSDTLNINQKTSQFVLIVPSHLRAPANQFDEHYATFVTLMSDMEEMISSNDAKAKLHEAISMMTWTVDVAPEEGKDEAKVPDVGEDYAAIIPTGEGAAAQVRQTTDRLQNVIVQRVLIQIDDVAWQTLFNIEKAERAKQRKEEEEQERLAFVMEQIASQKKVNIIFIAFD